MYYIVLDIRDGVGLRSDVFGMGTRVTLEKG